MNQSRALAAWACAAFISGCGGSGGLGSDDGGSFTLATSSVSFSARADTVTPPEGQTVEATARGGTVYLDVSFDSGPGSPIGNASLSTSLLSATAQIRIVPKSATALGAGVFSGTVTVRGCKDSVCSGQVSGSPKRISVGYRIDAAPPGIAVDATIFRISAARGQSSLPSQDLTVTADSGESVEYTTDVTYDSGATGWLTVPPTATAPNVLHLAVNSTASTSTSNRATLTLTPTNTAAPKRIAIFYSIADSRLALLPASVGFEITSTSPASAVQQVVNIGSTGNSLNWTATTPAGWLDLSAASGTTDSQLTLSLKPAALQSYARGAYSSVVRIGFGPSQSDFIQLPVTMNLQLPHVNVVAPYVSLSGSTEQFIVRGSGFDAMTTERVLLGSNPVAAFTRVSDTELHVTPPSLSAGRYDFTIENQGNFDRSFAALVVVDPATYPYAAYARTGGTPHIIYEPGRRSLYVGNSLGSVDRYTFDAGTWTRTTNNQLSGLRAMALSPDGSEITLLQSLLSSLDPTTLVATSRGTYGGLGEQIAYGNHGLARIGTALSGIATTGATYNFRSHTTVRSVGRPYYLAQVASSGDGSRIYIASKNAPAPQSVDFENASTGEVVATSLLRNAQSMAADRKGNRLVVVGVTATEVFDRDFVLLGQLPATTLAATLTPDGRRAYTYDSSVSIRAFDLTASLPSSSSTYPEIGPPTALADPPGGGAVMSIAPDSNTLFIAGYQHLLIVPAP